MKTPLRMTTIVGARPQFIKAAAVSRAIARAAARLSAPPVVERILHTGQHYDAGMSQVFFDQLGIPLPQANLEIGSGPHGFQTGRMLGAIETVLLEDPPDRVLVYGDTNSTLAGALAAAKLGIPVAHVEAGLRSFNRAMPEEINRIVTDRLSAQLFCPTPAAVENLRREGVADGIHQVGDVMYDNALYYAGQARSLEGALLDRCGVKPGQYLLATVHRAENTDDPVRLKRLTEALASVSTAARPLLIPLHPRTRRRIEELQILPDSAMRLIDPVPYLEMIALERNAALILTDSGGVQKEAFFFQVPCVTLRAETEWTETVEVGANRLWSPAEEASALAAVVESMIRQEISRTTVEKMYGQGDASDQIVGLLTDFA
jgi:UDP-GlcNAc3NAcA epimerase